VKPPEKDSAFGHVNDDSGGTGSGGLSGAKVGVKVDMATTGFALARLGSWTFWHRGKAKEAPTCIDPVEDRGNARGS